MKANITYMWGDWPSYRVSSREDCKDDTDRSAYDALETTGDQCVQMGKVCIERIRDKA